jgi:hypothetical protein
MGKKGIIRQAPSFAYQFNPSAQSILIADMLIIILDMLGKNFGYLLLLRLISEILQQSQVRFLNVFFNFTHNLHISFGYRR